MQTGSLVSLSVTFSVFLTWFLENTAGHRVIYELFFSIATAKTFQAYRFDHFVDLRIRFGLCLGLSSNGSRVYVLDRVNPKTVNRVSWL